MKQVWNIFVFLGYIYGIDVLLLTRAEVRTLALSTGDSNITCGVNAVIRIDNVTVHAYETNCSTNISNECVLSNDDYRSIETRCNNTHTCTVEYPRNTSCLKQDRYFNFKYSCLVPTNLLCTFEFSFCVWMTGLNGGLPWRRYSASIQTKNLPKKDHTTNSQNGTYIYFKKEGNLRTATLKSEKLSFDKAKCLVLWYNKDETSSLIIYTPDSNYHEFNQTGGTPNSSWEYIAIDIPFVEGQSSEIVIEGTVGNSENAYIALDDIDIQDWHCKDSLFLSCNFEESLCKFEKKPEQQTNEDWARIRALGDIYGRPHFDHTNGHGFYIYTTSKTQDPEPRRVIIITFNIEIEVSCLSLWYFTYGVTPGHLNIYTMVKGHEKMLYSVIDRRKQLWIQFQANVHNAKQIFLEYNFTKSNSGGIALDDIYISPTKCADEKPFFNECKGKDEKLNILCPISNVLKEKFAFVSNHTMSCNTTNKHIENNLQHKFHTCNETTTCEFMPADLVNDDNCFYMQKQLQLKYSCISGTEPTTSKPNDVPTSSTSPQTGTSMYVTTEKQYISTFEHTGVISPSNLSNSSSVIGIVIGVILPIVVLAVCLVIAVIYVRRSRNSEKKANSIVVEKKNHSDYTGHQNVAFSPEVNVTTQTDYCEIRTSKHNDQYHDISDTFRPLINTINDDEYSEIANVVNSPNSNSNPSTNYHHQYITLDPNATGFDRSNPPTTLHNDCKNNHNSNETTSFTSGDDYALLDPDDLNESKSNTPKVLPLSENYVVLDPNETGFNRQENRDTVCNYDFATPINPTETSEDPYDVSKDETYDTSSNSRHKEKDNNIYSHMVDNVYDTTGNQRKKEESDATYDHFFGQQSEDDYDISKPL